MAVGDTVVNFSTIAAAAASTIQPVGTIEWVVHNIYCSPTTSAELYLSDGSVDLLIDSNTTGGWLDYHFHVSNARYLKVKNNSASSRSIGFDGIITKV